MNGYRVHVATTKAAARTLAEELPLDEAKPFLSSLRETVTYLERRVARETIALQKQDKETIIRSSALVA